MCSKLTVETLEQGVKYSKLTIETPERRHWRRSGVFRVNFGHISHLVLVFLLLILSRYMPARMKLRHRCQILLLILSEFH